MKNVIKLFLIIVFLKSALFSQDLVLDPDSIKIDQNLKGGYDLWVKQSANISSIMLTESSADPEKRAHSYSLRAEKYNEINGDEKRILNGKFLKQGLFSLMDSTLEDHPELGKAFHIFIPYLVVFGNVQNRSGKIQVLDGTWLNIRAFKKPYGDYSGGFKDNPFVLRVIQRVLPGPPEENYMEDTILTYSDIADKLDGDIVYSKGEDDLLNNIAGILDKTEGRTLDLVLALDTTKSMENDIPHLKKDLIELLKERTKKYEAFRLGIVLYKDYMEEYMVRTFPFSPDYSVIQRVLNSIKVRGGRDIPEAVYEALYAGIHRFDWINEARLIILIGDAPPHPLPRGKITKEIVFKDAEEKNIVIDTIILPQ